jgi:ribosomal protein S5
MVCTVLHLQTVLQGKGGYGIGVSKEANLAIFKAIRFAILDSINIPLYRNHTVYYPSKTKFVRTKISIFPRPSDFGITASPILCEACELLGIRDITVKVRCRAM